MSKIYIIRDHDYDGVTPVDCEANRCIRLTSRTKLVDEFDIKPTQRIRIEVFSTHGFPEQVDVSGFFHPQLSSKDCEILVTECVPTFEISDLDTNRDKRLLKMTIYMNHIDSDICFYPRNMTKIRNPNPLLVFFRGIVDNYLLIATSRMCGQDGKGLSYPGDEVKLSFIDKNNLGAPNITIRTDDGPILFNYKYCFDGNIYFEEYDQYYLEFIMPEKPVYIDVTVGEDASVKEENKMEPKTTTNAIVDTFTIPEQVAKRLSDLLVKQSIREKLLDQNIENAEKYERMENMLVPIVAEINQLKNQITMEYVPEKYQSDMYVWNYDGYDIDGCTVYIHNAGINMTQ